MTTNSNGYWKKAGVIGQWVMIVGAFISMWIYQNDRLTEVEAGLRQQMLGYKVIFEANQRRFDRLENIIDVRLTEIERVGRAQYHEINVRIDRLHGG